ncbi:AsnC family transcriptional regulator [Mesorhizobium sp. WSM1293]|uniref:Lrp/AsnC family transcriptional regulator n=1 Tax=Mesorhizobium sp. WSM1293 TaxID=1040984 RepID=UPI001FDA0BDC|nr:AsnC family transcriptional regulator [Mesorhizobium sp. WSM1293]
MNFPETAGIARDDLDRRILTALQKNNRLSFSELAEVVGSSAASCMRRVNKLRSDGVIRPVESYAHLPTRDVKASAVVIGTSRPTVEGDSDR